MAATLILAEVASFGLHAPRMGIYHDDWTILETFSAAGGFWAALRALAPMFAERPVAGLHYALFMAWGGFEGWRYQVLFLLLEAVGGLLLFRLLRPLLGGWPALTAALVTVIFPNHTATHHWLSISAWNVSLDLTLASLLFNERWSQGGHPGWLAASLGCFLLAVLDYEGSGLLPAAFLVAWTFRYHHEGRDWSAAAWASCRRFSPYLGALLIALLWQRWGLSLVWGRSNPRPITLSWRILLRFLQAWDALTVQTAELCLASWQAGLGKFGWGLGGLALGLSAAVAWTQGAQTSELKGWRSTALAAVPAALLAAWLPYALALYKPAVMGVMSRTMAGTGLAGGLVLAVLGSYGGVWWRRGLLFAVVWVFTLTNWEVSGQWVESWRLQRQILRKMAAHASELPPGSTVLAAIPTLVTKDPDSAIVFASHWDLGPALRLVTGRADLQALPGTTSFSFDAFGAVNRGGDGGVSRYPCEELYVYRFRDDDLVKCRPPDKGGSEVLFTRVCRFPHPAAVPSKIIGPE